MPVRDEDSAAVRFPPPLVYVAALVLGIAMHRIVPFSLGLSATARVAAAVVVCAAGLSLLLAAGGLFRRTGQDPKPWKTTPELVTTGVYRFSRNPMYVSIALLQAGVAAGLNNGWVLALVPVVLAVVYRIAIRAEEAYLARKFGGAFSAYRRSVRRWL